VNGGGVLEAAACWEEGREAGRRGNSSKQ